MAVKNKWPNSFKWRQVQTIKQSFGSYFILYSSSRREVKIIAQVIDRLLDRDKPLLPAYISLNEIKQIFDRDPQLWPISKSMAKLEASFKPLSSIITLKCNYYIYPFVQACLSKSENVILKLNSSHSIILKSSRNRRSKQKYWNLVFLTIEFNIKIAIDNIWFRLPSLKLSKVSTKWYVKYACNKLAIGPYNFLLEYCEKE